MATRIVEGKKPYTGGKAIDIDENKVISLRLRDENNLIIYDAGDNEIYVDLQLPDEITPTDAFPVGITTGRVIVDNGWDVQGTIIVAKTTSGDNIKILYADDGKLYMDNGTGSFKQIYFKADVDLIVDSLQAQIDVLSGLGKFLSLWDCATGEPISFPLEIPYEYSTGDWYMINNIDNTTNYRPSGTEYDETASSTVETDGVNIGDVYIYDGTVWLLQKNAGGGGGSVTFAQILGQPTDNTNLATALNAKQDTLTAGTNIQISNNVISATGGSDIVYATQAEYNALLPGALTDNKHYFIYTSGIISGYTITGSTTIGSFTPGSFSDLQGFYMSPDGENAYMTFWNSGNGRMAQYSLSTPWDISTASQTQYISVTKPNGFYFSNDGTYIFLSTEDGNNIVRYSLSTPWDISTASQDSGQVLNVDSTRFADNVCLSDDGDYIWFGVDGKYTIHQYELITPFDLTTATNHKTLNTSDLAPAVMVKNDGKYLYTQNNGVKQYELATPYDITSTATEIGSYSVSIGEQRCLFVSNDCKYWTIGNSSGGVTQFEAQPIS